MWSDGSFTEMFERMRRYLVRANGLDRGRSLVLMANILYADDVRNLPRALALTEEALPLLAGEPVSAVKALINGLVFARMSSERTLADTYARSLSVIETVHSKSIEDWRGRIAVGLGQHFEESGRFLDALSRFKDGAAFHQTNVGPHRGAEYGERDRRCYHAMSLAGCARMCIRLGRLDQAEAYAKQVSTARLPEEYNPHSGYLDALIAMTRGQLEGVEGSLRRILDDPRAGNDHEMRLMAAELLARYYSDTGYYDRACQTLYPIMLETGSARALLRMQRYLKSLRSKSA